MSKPGGGYLQASGCTMGRVQPKGFQEVAKEDSHPGWSDRSGRGPGPCSGGPTQHPSGRWSLLGGGGKGGKPVPKEAEWEWGVAGFLPPWELGVQAGQVGGSTRYLKSGGGPSKGSSGTCQALHSHCCSCQREAPTAPSPLTELLCVPALQLWVSPPW